MRKKANGNKRSAKKFPQRFYIVYPRRSLGNIQLAGCPVGETNFSSKNSTLEFKSCNLHSRCRLHCFGNFYFTFFFFVCYFAKFLSYGTASAWYKDERRMNFQLLLMTIFLSSAKPTFVRKFPFKMSYYAHDCWLEKHFFICKTIEASWTKDLEERPSLWVN